MHLICPNCGADYDIPEGMVPAAGRHVQCSACHTRWFVRGTALPAASEEQILTRLESWRPRPVPLPSPATAPDPAAAPRPRVAEPLRVVPAPAPAPAPESASESAPEPTPEPGLVAGPEPEDAAPAAAPAPVPLPRRDPPTKPADHPTVARPSPVPHGPARPVPRLDLDVPPRERESARPPKSRFLRGLLLVLVPALLAFGAYRFGSEIAARVPAAEPALDAYAAAIDGWREDIERQVAPLRPGEDG